MTEKLNFIVSDKYQLKKYIDLTIEKKDDSFIACFHEAMLYGYGKTKLDAVDDFRKTIINQYDFLLNQKCDLESIPKHQFEVLQNYLMKL
jgi:hypothetical protein